VARPWNWVVTAARKGLAAQQAPQSHRTSAKRAMVLDSFGGILRARGNKTAGAGQHRRDDSLVKTQCELKKFLHCFYFKGSATPSTLLGVLRPRRPFVLNGAHFRLTL